MYLRVLYSLCKCDCVQHCRPNFLSVSTTWGSTGWHLEPPSLYLSNPHTHAVLYMHTHIPRQAQNHPSSVWKTLKALTLLLFAVIECWTTLSHSLIPSLFCTLSFSCSPCLCLLILNSHPKSLLPPSPVLDFLPLIPPSLSSSLPCTPIASLGC